MHVTNILKLQERLDSQREKFRMHGRTEQPLLILLNYPKEVKNIWSRIWLIIQLRIYGIREEHEEHMAESVVTLLGTCVTVVRCSIIRKCMTGSKELYRFLKAFNIDMAR
ncbi:uncharacterized protein LOC117173530 [Belonocnema kinseyi]|uniref:uncharacterized protein LOC117173530 n=1 Tax=Belonocnema kinseyi TaxID=2817044 RepID=UPI00143DA46F|nr:uncharacterized protein LOC117173530 [Belonocnema kinseyi]